MQSLAFLTILSVVVMLGVDACGSTGNGGVEKKQKCDKGLVTRAEGVNDDTFMLPSGNEDSFKWTLNCNTKVLINSDEEEQGADVNLTCTPSEDKWITTDGIEVTSVKCSAD